MYLGDAREFVRPQREQKPVPVDPKLAAWWSERGRSGSGHTVGKRQLGYSPDQICRYVNGRHACYDYSDYCPAVEPRVYVHQVAPDNGIVFRRRVG